MPFGGGWPSDFIADLISDLLHGKSQMPFGGGWASDHSVNPEAPSFMHVSNAFRRGVGFGLFAPEYAGDQAKRKAPGWDGDFTGNFPRLMCDPTVVFWSFLLIANGLKGGRERGDLRGPKVPTYGRKQPRRRKVPGTAGIRSGNTRLFPGTPWCRRSGCFWRI